MKIVELRGDGAIVLTASGIHARRAALMDFYVGVTFALVGFVSTMFLVFSDVPEDFRITFIWVVAALTVASFRTGYTYALLRRWFARP